MVGLWKKSGTGYERGVLRELGNDEVFVGPMSGLEISCRDAQGCMEAGC